MSDKLTPLRMIELEKFLRNETNITNLDVNDSMYIESAKKMPFDEIISCIVYFKQNINIDSVKYFQSIMEKFSVTRDELIIRLREVHAIRGYNNSHNKRLRKNKKMK